MKKRRTIQYRVENQKREGRKKIHYTCIICKIQFFSIGKRNHKICNRNKCQNHLKNLSAKIQRLHINIDKIDERKFVQNNKLVALEIQYNMMLNKI